MQSQMRHVEIKFHGHSEEGGNFSYYAYVGVNRGFKWELIF
jgi:hypothetical protein